jgi:hypothetical protein
MFPRLTRKPPEITAGASYSRPRRDNVVEIAKVIAIRPDAAGIPHVRFNLHIESGIRVLDEERTLSLSRFSECFRERVTA